MVRILTLAALVVVQVLLMRALFFTPDFSIAFLDVGQGDAIYIRAENGNDVLIDGGPSRQVLGQLSKQMPFLDRSIDVVIATHPDLDHIGGLSYVFDRYEVDHFIDPGISRGTGAYTSLKDASQEATYTLGRKGLVIRLSSNTYIEVLFPDREIQGNINNNSVVTLVTHKDKKFLLMGDVGKEIERYLQDSVPDVDLIKVGHHGSNTSTDENFIQAVSPEYAVISAGKDNRYGHPHEEVLEVLQGTKILGTYDRGTIVFEVKGGELFLK